MKIGNKVELTQTQKLSGKSPAKISHSKSGKSGKAVSSRDKAELIREKEAESGRKLGIIGEAKKAGTARPKKNWTVMHYLSIGDVQEEIWLSDLLKMQEAGSNSKMNLLAQVDRGDEFNTVKWHGGKPGTTRYYLTPQKDPERLTSEEIAHYGQTNAADHKNLEDFLAWGMKNYPAEHYLVIVEGHGSGVTGTLWDAGKEAKTHDTMTLPELSGAVKRAEQKTGVDKDQVMVEIDSCLMGTAEMAYEMKDSAALLNDSQAVVYCLDLRPDLALRTPGAGDFSLREMGENIAEIKAKRIGEKNPMGTNALIDLKQMPNLKKAVLDFKKAVKHSPEAKETLKAILEVESRPNFESDTTISFFASDFHSLAQGVAQNRNLKDPELQKAARKLKAVLDKALIKQSRWEDNAEFNKNAVGIGVTTASEPAFYAKTGYSELAFEQDTGWGEFMTSYAPEVKAGGKAGLSDPVFEMPLSQDFTDEDGIPRRYVIDEDKTAGVSQKWLGNKAGFKKEVAEAKRRIKNLKYETEIPPIKQKDKIFSILANTGMMLEAWQSTVSEPVQKIIVETLSIASGKPELAGEILKTGLLALSGLDKEVSAKTIADSARNLLESKANIRPGLKNKVGALLIGILAKSTRNDRVIAALNQGGLDAEKQLKAVADLNKSPKAS